MVGGTRSILGRIDLFLRMMGVWYGGKGRTVPDPRVSTVRDPRSLDDQQAMQRLTSLGESLKPLRAMTYSQFWQLVAERRVDRVVLAADGGSLTAYLNRAAPGGARKVTLGLPFDPDLLDHLIFHGVRVERVPDLLHERAARALLRFSVPLVLASLAAGAAGGLVSLDLPSLPSSGSSRTAGSNFEVANPDQNATRLDDVAGIGPARAELESLVRSIRDPLAGPGKLGAKPPTGVLLAGPPGTGKTLAAKAVAGEAKVPILNASGSEFVSAYAGSGAARVRDLFSAARSAAPCVVFIDELDGLARARSAAGGGDPEAVGTLNQLLVEMDGFGRNGGIVVMAATNRPDVLDPAVTRPGRFDRLVRFGAPSLEGRYEILKIHCKARSLEPSVDLRKIAAACPGASGASLAGLARRAAEMAHAARRPFISQKDLDDAAAELASENAAASALGALAAPADAAEQDADVLAAPLAVRRPAALYEAARLVVALALGPARAPPPQVARVTLRIDPPEDPGALLDLVSEATEGRDDEGPPPRGLVEGLATTSLAGRCAERMVLGEAHVTARGGVDLRLANRAARDLVLRMGAGRRTGLAGLRVVFDPRGTEAVKPTLDASGPAALLAQRDVEDLLDRAEARAYVGLVRNWKLLEAFTHALLAKPTIEGPEIRAIVARVGLEPYGRDEDVEAFDWYPDGTIAWPSRDRDARNGAWALGERGQRLDPADDPDGVWDLSDLDRRDVELARRRAAGDVMDEDFGDPCDWTNPKDVERHLRFVEQARKEARKAAIAKAATGTRMPPHIPFHPLRKKSKLRGNAAPEDGAARSGAGRDGGAPLPSADGSTEVQCVPRAAGGDFIKVRSDAPWTLEGTRRSWDSRRANRDGGRRPEAPPKGAQPDA